MNPVIAALRASSAVAALIGAGNLMRAYAHGTAPQGTARPYITVEGISGSPVNNLSENPDSDDTRIRVNCWAESEQTCYDLWIAARDAVEVETHIVFGPLDDYEPDTKLFRTLFDAEFWLSR